MPRRSHLLGVLGCALFAGCDADAPSTPAVVVDPAGPDGGTPSPGVALAEETAILDAAGPRGGKLISIAGCPHTLELVFLDPNTVMVHVLDLSGKRDVMLEAPCDVILVVDRPKELGGGVQFRLGPLPPEDNPAHRGSFSRFAGGTSLIGEGLEQGWPITVKIQEWLNADSMTYSGELNAPRD